nr:cycloartenol synthase 2-like isoform X6 [Ipomoea batatas]
MWKLKLSEGKNDPWLRSVNNHIGRQYWEFDSNLGTPEEQEQVEKLRANFHKNRFEIKHSSDLLMRMQVIGLSVMGAINTALQEEHQKEMLRYIYNHQNVDGGWGLHIEGHSTMFCTALNYVSLRILGEESDGGNGAMKEARKWILDHGGATFIPSWGKIWLSEDLYYPHPAIQDIVWDGLHNIVEPLLNKWPFNNLRKKALTLVMDHIQYEDEATNYVCIGPVNKIKEDSGINLSSWYRQSSKGGWPFSTPESGWSLCDCTSEALKAALMLSRMPDDVVGEAMEPSRLYDAVDLILSLQVLNPSEIFADIIIDYS